VELNSESPESTVPRSSLKLNSHGGAKLPSTHTGDSIWYQVRVTGGSEPRAPSQIEGRISFVVRRAGGLPPSLGLTMGSVRPGAG